MTIKFYKEIESSSDCDKRQDLNSLPAWSYVWLLHELFPATNMNKIHYPQS